MPITDLSSVTRTIIKLLQLGIDPATTPTTLVSAIPPDEVESTNANQVSVHLLHVTESPEYKNFPPGPRMRKVPIQQLPMGLVLQYVVSIAREATPGDSTSDEALLAQKLLGRIARLFHDFPVITPTTIIGPPPTPPQLVLQGELADAKDNLELILRPAPLEENLNFWATQNQKLARACLYVEARVAVLQEKPPEILPGIVLSVGNFVFPSAGPQLFNSLNTLTFQPPNQPGLATAAASPARVAMFPDDTTLDSQPYADNDLLTIEASGLSPGKRTLLLRSGQQSFSVDLDDPPLNPNWQLSVGSNAITLRFRTEIRARVGSPPVLSIVRLAPGIYGARLMLEDTRLGPTARPRTSNEIAFAAIPQVVSAAPTAPPTSNDYTLTIAGRYLVELPGAPDTPGFPDPDPAPAAPPPTVFVPTIPDVELMVNGLVLTRVNDGGVTYVNGTYFVSAPDTIRFKLFDPGTPATTPGAGNPLPVQLLVNGASATPAWLTAAAPP